MTNDNKTTNNTNNKEIKDVNAELGLDEGVTDDAPYKNIAEYKMVTYLSDDENENKKNIANTHSS